MNVAGLFETFEDGSSTLEDLVSNGFSRRDISLICGDPQGDYTRRLKEGKPLFKKHDVTHSTEGAAAGAVVGGSLGFLAGLTALMVPVVGPAVAIGAIAEGLLIGTAAGGQVGLLQDASDIGMQAEQLVEKLRCGGCLVVVPCEDQISTDLARSLMARNRAIEVHSREIREAHRERPALVIREKAA